MDAQTETKVKDAPAAASARSGAFAPLREPVFRRLWIASVMANFGQLILGVGAAWEMTRLSTSPGMVALVQTAVMLPVVFVSLPAGAMADMFDRRRIAMIGLGLATVFASILTVIAFLGMTTPWLLLTFCALIGSGAALYYPAWQASIGEQVSADKLPAAIALGTISFNVARSFGPAVGGLIVLAMGAKAAFGINAVFYLPLILTFYLWKRTHLPSRLPPERIDRAIMAGMRYARHSVPVRAVVGRALAFGLASAATYGLMPLVAKDLLAGNAGVYGVLLGSLGVGAVIGALFVSQLRARFSTETVVKLCSLCTALALPVIGFSRWMPLTCAAIAVNGACNILVFAMLNVSVQLSAPRWVTARALSLYSSALSLGLGFGSWVWGEVAGFTDVTSAFVISGVAVILTLGLGGILRLPGNGREEDTAIAPLANEPELNMDLTLRSGPVVIEIEYDVDPDRAREFHAVMTRMEDMRRRIGGFDWSISRDIANPALWIERYHCPTWGDYLRMRDRYTQADIAVQALATSFDRHGDGQRVRRFLERPYGSVRWKAESPDPKVETVGYLTP